MMAEDEVCPVCDSDPCVCDTYDDLNGYDDFDDIEDQNEQEEEETQ
jgi:hypothetical protein